MQRVRRHGPQTTADKTHPLVPRQGDTDPFPLFSGFATDGAPVPTQPPTIPFPYNGGSRTQKGVAGTPAPAQAPAKTQQGPSKCTPSPTKPLAPSASEYDFLFQGAQVLTSLF